MKYSEMYPEGRRLFYKGDDWKSFCDEMRTRFDWEVEKEATITFVTPPHLLDELHGKGYPLSTDE